MQDLQGLLARKGIGEVPEVDELDQLLWSHPAEQEPERQADSFRFEIPESVDHGADRHMHNALLRA